MISARKPRRQKGLRGFFGRKYRGINDFLACPKFSPHKHVKERKSQLVFVLMLQHKGEELM